MAKWFSYDVFLGRWSMRTRARTASDAKEFAAKWYKDHKRDSRSKRSIHALIKMMKARRAE